MICLPKSTNPIDAMEPRGRNRSRSRAPIPQFPDPVEEHGTVAQDVPKEGLDPGERWKPIGDFPSMGVPENIRKWMV